MTRPFTVKMTDAELSALESLLSHDAELIELDDSEGDGLITPEERLHLLALYNRAQARAHVTREDRDDEGRS